MSKKILFLDESGDHNLTIIDNQHPIFLLGGIIVDEEYAFNTMQEKINQFKLDLFNTTDITLHTADFTRQKNGFENMKNKDFCDTFYHKLNNLINDLDIQIVACGVKKSDHLKKYGLNAIDPYLFSLNILVEKLCYSIKNKENAGLIIAEARDPILDRQLDLAWLKLKISGTYYIRPKEITTKISDLILKRKKDKLAGLEIADAVVTPLARMILERLSRIDINILKSKMVKNKFGDINSSGLTVLPKKES